MRKYMCVCINIYIYILQESTYIKYIFTSIETRTYEHIYIYIIYSQMYYQIQHNRNTHLRTYLHLHHLFTDVLLNTTQS